MERTALCGLTLGLLLLCSGVVSASEADQLRERAREAQKEAAARAERGNREEAERLEREARNLLEAAERSEQKAGEKGDRRGIEEAARRLKERLHDLHAHEKRLREASAPERELAAVREQIAATERELHSIQSRCDRQEKLPPEFRPQAEKLEAAVRKIHHLRVAAENLKMAEAHDLARQIMEQAEAMEREVQEGKRQLAAQIQRAHAGDHGPDVVRELREAVERLQAEVKELRQKVENR